MMETSDRVRFKEMAINAMTGHLKIADPIYELGKALEMAIDEHDEVLRLQQENETLEEANSELQVEVYELKEKLSKINDLST